jgi:hypothetical protein
MNRTTLNVLLVVVAFLVLAPSQEAAPEPTPGPDVVTPVDLRMAVQEALSGNPAAAKEYARLYQAAAELHDVAHPMQVRDWTTKYVAMDPFPRVPAMQDVLRKHFKPFEGLVSESQWTAELKEKHKRALFELAAACRRSTR